MGSHFKRSLLAIAVAGSLSTLGTAHATNGYQLIGIGAYQKSLAGAVTANPGSAMTAVTNPAGLAKIPDRADFSMEMFMPDRYTDFSGLAGDKVDSDATEYGIPSLGWKAPVGNQGNMWFGGGMYGTSGLGADYESTLVTPAFPGLGAPAYFDGYSSIAFWQMSPALAWQVNEKLSLGAALNVDYQMVGFKQRFQADTDATPGPDTTVANFDLSKGASGFGYGITLGLLYDVTDRFAVGASYKSKQMFDDFEYNLGYADIQDANLIGAPGVGAQGEMPAGKYALEMDYPQQWALGVAFDVTPAVTVSADVKWINWSDTMKELKIKTPLGFTIPFSADWDDQYVYAIGVAWAVNSKVNLRAGYNYAEAPIEDEDVSNNLILPAVVTTHYTFGGDVKLGQGWELGFHYMYVPEETLKSPSNDPSLPNVEIGMDQSSFGMNIGYTF